MAFRRGGAGMIPGLQAMPVVAQDSGIASPGTLETRKPFIRLRGPSEMEPPAVALRKMPDGRPHHQMVRPQWPVRGVRSSEFVDHPPFGMQKNGTGHRHAAE